MPQSNVLNGMLPTAKTAAKTNELIAKNIVGKAIKGKTPNAANKKFTFILFKNSNQVVCICAPKYDGLVVWVCTLVTISCLEKQIKTMVFNGLIK